MKDILSFDKMLTPKIITGVYYLLLIASVLGGSSVMFSGQEGFTLGKFVLGLFCILGGALAARIWCELLIVLFKMNESLHEIKVK